ncbi:hypothetical protein GQ55_6G058600 [Panicum hallii var. hallii]|uniref:Uncharacterized protein n=1 Tax=Panicum hallii var. hallii TaxID=1504633 RepID=A0A2T7D4F9_9POAL|nr:hypothetical protein GQ55_6G058600 [Panicum hallii var. hallii]
MCKAKDPSAILHQASDNAFEGRGSSCWLRRRTATRQLGRQHQHPTLCMNRTSCHMLTDRDAEALSSTVTSAFAREST